MLVLTRRTNQSIMIGDEVEISVLSVSGEKVRIGIDAPTEIPVFRKEVYLRIAAERESKEGAPDDSNGSRRRTQVRELTGSD